MCGGGVLVATLLKNYHFLKEFTPFPSVTLSDMGIYGIGSSSRLSPYFRAKVLKTRGDSLRIRQAPQAGWPFWSPQSKRAVGTAFSNTHMSQTYQDTCFRETAVNQRHVSPPLPIVTPLHDQQTDQTGVRTVGQSYQKLADMPTAPLCRWSVKP